MSASASKQPSARRGPLAVQIRFERFPLSVKGAFVMRGGDGDPHSVRFDWGRVARVPAGSTWPFPVESRQFDVSPTRDLFVPLEAPVTELPPGWYRLEASVTVDGASSLEVLSRAFPIPWPRNEVRRGAVVLGQNLRVRGTSFRVERVDMTGDSAAVVWGPPAEGAAGASDEGALPGNAVLVADGVALEPLPDDAPAAAARSRTDLWRTLSYPVPRACRSLVVVIRAGAGSESNPVKVPLP